MRQITYLDSVSWFAPSGRDHPRKAMRLELRLESAWRWAQCRKFVAVVVGLWLMASLAPAANAKPAHRSTHNGQTASKMIAATRGGRIMIRRGVQLVVPSHTLTANARVTVSRLGPGYAIKINVPWHGKLYVVTRNNASSHSVARPLGGLLVRLRRAGHKAQAASLLDLAAEICVEVGPDGAEFLDGALVFACLDVVLADNHSHSTPEIPKTVAMQIAKQISSDCATAVAQFGSSVPTTVFKEAVCNPLRGQAIGPSNGTPLVVVTLTPPTLHGTPIGNSTPNPSPGPKPIPGPTPTPTPLASGEFAVMNAEGGIYWRSAPDWNTAEAVSGNGFYPGTIIKVACYQAGAANVPGSADGMWEQASWVSGPGRGSGWINEHFIADGQPINQPSPGVPACPPSSPPPPPQTWSEQETPNHPVNTFTDYHNASGEGPPIAAGLWVQVSCKVYDPTIQSVNPDGYWYRIASSPWNNAYYSPANTFMNGDPYGGPYTHNTDFSVPNC